MTFVDVKGRILARQANLEAQLMERRKTVLCIEADLIRARREADMAEGALVAISQDLAEVEQALQMAGKPPAGPVQAPGTSVAAPAAKGPKAP